MSSQFSKLDSTLIKLILRYVQEGNLDVIKSSLAKYNPDPNDLKDPNSNQNAFFSASLIPDDALAVSVLQYLASIKVNPNQKDDFHQTCLYYTCRDGKLLSTQYLIQEWRLDLNTVDWYGQTPIYYAIRENHINIVKFWISHGADINTIDKYGQNCIFYSVRENWYDMTDLLIKSGAHLDVIDKKKMNLTMFAEKFSFPNIVNLLVLNGAPQLNKTKNTGLNMKGSMRKNSKNSKSSANNDKKQKKTNGKQRKINTNKYSFLPRDKRGNPLDINLDQCWLEAELANEQQKKIEQIQVRQPFVWIKIDDKGTKSPWTEEEVKEFMLNNEEIMKWLNDQEERDKLKDKAFPSLYLEDSWEKHAMHLLNTLWDNKNARIFHYPVDPVKLNILDYFNYVKNPMDFSTIKNKLNSYWYTNWREFIADIELTFNNCFIYNGEESEVGNMCTNVKWEYVKLFSKMQLHKFL